MFEYVYLSHIIRYIEYTKDDVSVLITGGAGVELNKKQLLPL